MRKLLLFITSLTLSLTASAQMSLQGVLDLSLSGSSGKAIHVVADSAIADLSIYGIGIANNGGGTDGQEYTFPADSVQAGEHILVVRDSAAMAYYFEGCFGIWRKIYVDASGNISQNGDDAVELFKNGNVIETFGDINVDGTGQPWEYLDSWAYKVDTSWTYGAVNCTDGDTLNIYSSCPYPACPDMIELAGIIDFTVPSGGSNGKAIHLKTNWDIADLSIYGIGVANNGGGTDGVEYVLPAVSALAGENILVVRDSLSMALYFGACFAEFDHVFTDANGGISQNGDDAIELFKDSVAFEVFGDVDVDGTGQPWEYIDSWAFKNNGQWIFGGVNCTNTGSTTFTSPCPYPICTVVLADSLTLAGDGGATTITVKGDSLQMMATLHPATVTTTDVVWNVNDTSIATIGAMGMLYAKTDGVVTVSATTVDGSGVSGTTDITITGQNIGLMDRNLDHLTVYPNPTNGSIQIKGLTESTQYQIFTLQGSLVQAGKVTPRETITLNKLSSGTYMLRLNNSSSAKNIKLFVTQF